jgi:hypothetical protein
MWSLPASSAGLQRDILAEREPEVTGHLHRREPEPTAVAGRWAITAGSIGTGYACPPTRA